MFLIFSKKSYKDIGIQNGFSTNKRKPDWLSHYVVWLFGWLAGWLVSAHVSRKRRVNWQSGTEDFWDIFWLMEETIDNDNICQLMKMYRSRINLKEWRHTRKKKEKFWKLFFGKMRICTHSFCNFYLTFPFPFTIQRSNNSKKYANAYQNEKEVA